MLSVEDYAEIRGFVGVYLHVAATPLVACGKDLDFIPSIRAGFEVRKQDRLGRQLSPSAGIRSRTVSEPDLD